MPADKSQATSTVKHTPFFPQTQAEESISEKLYEQIPGRDSLQCKTQEITRMFSSYFSKDEADKTAMKAINEDTLMELNENYEVLKSKCKKLEEDCDLYKKQFEDVMKENDELNRRIAEMKNLEDNNKELEGLKEDYEKIIERFKVDLENANAHIHVLRGQILEIKSSENLLNEYKEKLDVLEKEKALLIKNMLYYKEETAHNYNFYNGELEKARKDYIQAKIDSSQILMDKEYFSFRCKQLETILKQQKTYGNLENI